MMGLLSTAKWIASAGPISKTEKLVSVAVVSGLNYLAKKAMDRGDFHEANHNMIALMAGSSTHEHGEHCVFPADRLLRPEESFVLVEQLRKKSEDPNFSVGLYL